jgi:hypothetical protein
MSKITGEDSGACCRDLHSLPRARARNNTAAPSLAASSVNATNIGRTKRGGGHERATKRGKV